MDPIKEVIYIQREIYFNDNNLGHLAPFWSDDGNTLLLLEEQYDAWNKTDALELLQKEFEHIERVKTIKHLPENIFESEKPDWYYKVYNTILKRTEVTRWYHLINNAMIVPINNNLTILARNIQKALDTINENNKPENGWFVKSGSCSTKHNYPPEPVFSGIEAAQHLLGSTNVLNSIKNNRTDYVLIRPWIKEINDLNEVRVFVRENKIVGVSQQACYSGYSMVLRLLDAKEVIKATQKCYDDFSSKLEDKYKFNYECTFDAYISTDTEGNITVHLIEINSEMFGWGPAGSSLFSWIYNPPPKINEPPKFLVTGVL